MECIFLLGPPYDPCASYVLVVLNWGRSLAHLLSLRTCIAEPNCDDAKKLESLGADGGKMGQKCLDG